jgi:hypothetical protein
MPHRIIPCKNHEAVLPSVPSVARASDNPAQRIGKRIGKRIGNPAALGSEERSVGARRGSRRG